MLERVTDLSATNWIRKTVLSMENFASRGGNYVEHCIPAIYEAYGKIFHNMYEDTSVDNKTVTWDDLHKQKPVDLGDPLQTVLHDATKVYGGECEKDPDKLIRIRWKELSDRYGLQYHADLNVESFTRSFPTQSWPRYLTGPDEGMLEGSTCKEIVRSIATATSDFDLSQECFFLYDLIATTNYESDLLYRGRLKSVFDTYQLDDISSTPTYWWPIDQTWLVCTDWDLPFTLIGGSEKLISTIMSNHELECLPVAPTNRIDYKSDTINR